MQIVPDFDVSARMSTLTYRPVEDADQPFLMAVYASTREEELKQVDWTAEQKTAFVAMQFLAQHRHYQTHYRQTDFLAVLCDGVPCGRLYLARWASEFRVVELTLLPTFRGRGLGGRILDGVLVEADAAGLPVRIHVEHNNPAARLYRRLGFVAIEDHGVHTLMERPCRVSQDVQPSAAIDRESSCPAC